MKINPRQLAETKFGFDWGGVAVERVCSESKGSRSWLVLSVKTPSQRWELRVTATGRVRCVRRKDVEAAERKEARKAKAR